MTNKQGILGGAHTDHHRTATATGACALRAGSCTGAGKKERPQETGNNNQNEKASQSRTRTT